MLAYKKSASSLNPPTKENEPSSTHVCNCCREEIDPMDHCELSCGHVYHYDCIYYAFSANIKRGTYVKECPYCRKKVNPLPEKAGFPFDNYIHSLCGVGGVNKKIDKSHFAPTHLGKGYCAFKNGNNLYCNSPNATYGVGSSYCYGHRNGGHLGKNYCKYKTTGGIYCNTFLIANTTGSVAFCKNHSECVECTEVIKSGKNKGTVCGNMNCKRHKPKHDVVMKEVPADASAAVAVNSIKIVELDDPTLQLNDITVYKEVAESASPKSITLDASKVAVIRFLLQSIKNGVSKKEADIIDNLLDNYFS